jgi:hypothetical protein
MWPGATRRGAPCTATDHVGPVVVGCWAGGNRIWSARARMRASRSFLGFRLVAFPMGWALCSRLVLFYFATFLFQFTEKHDRNGKDLSSVKITAVGTLHTCKVHHPVGSVNKHRDKARIGKLTRQCRPHERGGLDAVRPQGSHFLDSYRVFL